MTVKHIKNFFFFLAVSLLVTACKKFLDTKSNQSLSTPDTLDDLQALLDNQYFYRYGVTASQNASDEYYLPFTTWDGLIDPLKGGHVWDPNVDYNQDWIQKYSLILMTNTVLDRLDKIKIGSEAQRADEIRGSALFVRSYNFYHLAQIFAPQYDPVTAQTDNGIVLRLEPDFNIPSERSSVQQTCYQIIADLQLAVTLLPLNTVANTRPNRAAGYALLARVYLQIGDLQKAKSAAEQSISLYDHLIDYNDPAEVNRNSNTIPIRNRTVLNKEILYYDNDEGSVTSFSTAIIDSSLYRSYDGNDIRKKAFFRPNAGGLTYRFKGSYSGGAGQFIGISTPEVYLIKAESNARLGNISDAMQALDQLLIKRFNTGTAPVLNPATPEEALQIVLAERRREMVLRGVRWSDLRRLNKNPATTTILKRDLNGTIYVLPPNDPRYTFLIPSSIMQLSKLTQNPR